jgi:hypothetical protein
MVFLDQTGCPALLARFRPEPAGPHIDSNIGPCDVPLALPLGKLGVGWAVLTPIAVLALAASRMTWRWRSATASGAAPPRHGLSVVCESGFGIGPPQSGPSGRDDRCEFALLHRLEPAALQGDPDAREIAA